MNLYSQAWIAVAESLVAAPNSQVKCPQCDKGSLQIENIVLPNRGILEVRIFCEICGAANYLLKPRIAPADN
jgi:hypothetical protein